MELQARVMFAHDERGRLLSLNEPGNDPVSSPAPRFFLGRTPGGNLRRYRHDLPDTQVQALEGIAAKESAFNDSHRYPIYAEEYLRLLNAESEAGDIYCGPAYRFPPALTATEPVVRLNADTLHLFQPNFPWIGEVYEDESEPRPPCAGAMRDGIVVAVCHSARFMAQGAEAGVETLEAYRGQGCATAAVAGWAQSVRAMGREPLYNTSWENLASQGVARKLGLIFYGADYSVT